MNLCKDIEKATHINWNNDHALFVQSQEHMTEDENFNKFSRKAVKNENLLENDVLENDVISECFINETEIGTYINMVNGGINYSNECIEQHWKSRQQKIDINLQIEETNIQSTSSQSKNKDNEITCTENSSQTDILKNEATMHKCSSEQVTEVLKKCKLNRNAAIQGLIKERKIKLEDLKIPGESSDNRDSTNQAKYRMKLVPHPEDPDVLIHPFQAFGDIHEEEYKEIDFTVPRIGKKKTVAPHEYYLYETDDSFFDFVDKKKV